MNEARRTPPDSEYFVQALGGIPVGEVVAYRGKHAVKTERFFEIVAARQAQCMPSHWRYRPLKIEVELTDRCDQSCPHCGMAARSASGGGPVLPDELLFALPDQLHAFGIPGISLTGGEPFLVLDRLLTLLERCRDRVDVVKISTNASWASSPREARRVLGALRDHGLAAGQLFRPVLLVSVGEQAVPLDRVALALGTARELFDDRELALCVSSLAPRFAGDRLDELDAAWRRTIGGEFPWDQIFLTSRTYMRAGRGEGDPLLPRRDVPLSALCKPRGCFQQTIGAVVVPTPLVKAGGEAYSCSVFGMPAELRIGSLMEHRLAGLLERANRNPYVGLLARGSLPMLAACLRPGALEGETADNFHEACWRLIALAEEAAPGRAAELVRDRP